MWRILFIVLVVVGLAAAAWAFGLPQKVRHQVSPAETTTAKPATQKIASPPAKVEPVIVVQKPDGEESVSETKRPSVTTPVMPVKEEVSFVPGPSIFDEPPPKHDADTGEDYTDGASIFDAPPPVEELAVPRGEEFEEKDFTPTKVVGPRYTTLSRAEVDAEVGYVPEPEPIFRPSIPPPVPMVVRPPPRRFTVLGEVERRKGRYGGRRHCRQHPRGCPRQCRRRPRHPGYRVARPAYPAMYARPVRPAYSGYGPAWR